MSHPLQLRYDSKAVELRATQLFLELKELEVSAQIGSKARYLQEFYQRLRTFYETIDRPLFQVREADMLPSSADYNAMIAELLKDLELLYIEAGQLRTELDASFMESEIDRAILDERIRRSEDRMRELSLRSIDNVTEAVFRDGFIDGSLRDDSRNLDDVAHTWTREGVLTLKPSEASSHIESAVIRIKSGNGLPGNTKQAKAVSGEIRFVGEDAMHLNLADLLDGNADTWFEYERFHLPEETLKAARGYGFSYTEGVEWASGKEEPMTLVLEIELPTAQPVNWFSVHPFIPSERGAKAAVVESIELHDGQGKVFRPLKEEEDMDNEKVYLFGRKTCKRIVLTLRQPHYYGTEVGHRYYQEIETRTLNYLERMKEQPGKRLQSVDPSIQALGLGYDHEESKVIYPDIRTGHVFPEIEEYKEELFTLPVIQEEDMLKVKNGIELLNANRQAIGLRDIGVAHYQFEQTSDYTSVLFETKQDIVAVSLVVDQEIPEEFPEGDWLRYFVSPDDGENWYRIHPKGVTKKDAKLLYLFNTRTPVEGRLDHFGYADLDKPVKSLRLRVELERPDSIEGAAFYTPLVKSYELHAVLGGA